MTSSIEQAVPEQEAPEQAVAQQAAAQQARPIPAGLRPPSTPQLIVSASAGPDVDDSTPGVQVYPGSIVLAIGSSYEMYPDGNTLPRPFTWALTFAEPGSSTQTDITDQLQSWETLTPNFLAESVGTYSVSLTGTSPDGPETKTATAEVTVVVPPFAVQEATGLITFLRANDLGTAYGPSGDRIDVEAVVKLDSTPDQAYGFQLRNDQFRPSRQAMFDLLREAHFQGRAVTLHYLLSPGKRNGTLTRVAVRS